MRGAHQEPASNFFLSFVNLIAAIAIESFYFPFTLPNVLRFV